MKYSVAAVVLLALVYRVLVTQAEACDKCGGCHSCPAHECVKMPEKKTIKKVVYEVKCVPVCEHKPSKFLDCCCCPVCELRYKRVLIKREIVVCEICTTKCVPVELPCGCCNDSSCPVPPPGVQAADVGPAPPIDVAVEH